MMALAWSVPTSVHNAKCNNLKSGYAKGVITKAILLHKGKLINLLNPNIKI